MTHRASSRRFDGITPSANYLFFGAFFSFSILFNSLALSLRCFAALSSSLGVLFFAPRVLVMAASF